MLQSADSGPPQAPGVRGPARDGTLLHMDPWQIELIVVRGAGMSGGERRAVSRDAERGLLHRIRQGVWVDRAEWVGATGWKGLRARHLVAMRALAAVSPFPPVFSHWSAAVAEELPTVGQRFERVHVTVDDAGRRGIDGVAAHLFPLQPSEVTRVGPLLVTTVPRTVVDIAGGSRFDGGLMAADAALFRGLPRELLEQAVDLAGPRRAQRRILDVVAMAHPGAESAAESEGRWSMFQLGIAPQELQHEVRDRGSLVAVVDAWDERRGIATETDGDEKYLDPEMATEGTGRALIEEKKREDLVRALVEAFARYGYAEASDPRRLRPVLTRVGLLPEVHRPTIADYAAVASAARPRRRPFLPQRPRGPAEPVRG